MSDAPRPSPHKRHPLDKNVSPNWKPVAGLQGRKPGMLWSDRIWHWLVSLGGLAIIGCGVVLMAFIHPVLPHLHGLLGRAGGLMIGIGFCVFVLGFPSQAQRNGYRHM